MADHPPEPHILASARPVPDDRALPKTTIDYLKVADARSERTRTQVNNTSRSSVRRKRLRRT